ncbi:hypothetical protein Q7M76_05320 [Candidatus Liberibacter asiaticus]|uniref:Uncharacterized protein n=2 Tax=Liberibacter asiaticus TaxID=34021 RepID=C6XH03_LIBAP|nr:hypothetical protein [Candidatus Liberibacter asiaticus]ACT57656.1 hypothetical protein CLIBASIA_05450 [Candidatus Liberibacter asiaticus str. psy62]AGH17416.1 hypothetical protein WSI_05295 [Candidatus Liberibacter asiaticus str. gxpsy]ALK07690.1 hypothetical protein CD16_05280 [Candidatus Liberibacter asiaticus]ASK53185.1 hypothetical protein B2I23_05360 [Candidatus Liberibacter asiaticus]AWL14502.1 hypothetical protein DIC79_05380 [Candidatus Liberibacter asiaticus]
MLIWNTSKLSIFCRHCSQKNPNYGMCHAGVSKEEKAGNMHPTYAVGICENCGDLSLMAFQKWLPTKDINKAIGESQTKEEYFPSYEEFYLSKAS